MAKTGKPLTAAASPAPGNRTSERRNNSVDPAKPQDNDTIPVTGYMDRRNRSQSRQRGQ